MKPITLLFILLSASTFLTAHGLHMKATKEGDNLNILLEYSEGQGVKGAEVVLYSLKGEIIEKGLTGSEGSAVFKLKSSVSTSTIKIVADDGAGHIAELIFDPSKDVISNHTHNSADILYGGITILLIALSFYFALNKKEG